MLLFDIDKKVDLREFISTLKNRSKRIRNLFGENQNQLIIFNEKDKNKQVAEENVSGPCRDRTDDPQIKSLLLYRLS